MMYKLEPIVGKIESPVVLVFPNGSVQHYTNGEHVVKDTFDHHYAISRIACAEDEIILTLKEVEVTQTSWIGEEQVTFF